MMAVNTCCGVAPAECRAKHSLYDRVMKSTNVSLNADVSPAVKERRVRWTTYAILDAWFVNFCAFLIKFDFAGINERRRDRNFSRREQHESGWQAGRVVPRSPPSGDKQVHGKFFARLHGNIWQQHCRQVCTSALPVADERDGRGEGEDPIRVFDPHFGHLRQIWLRGGEDLAVYDRDE